MASKKDNTQRAEKLSLLWTFMGGAKRYFLVTVLAAGLTALADMLQPQIIRAAVDCALGGKEGDFPAFVMKAVNSIGGFTYLGEHLWIMALAILVVAAFQVAGQYLFRVYNTKASETLVKSMRDRLFSHIQRLPFSWHMKNRTGDIIQRCTSDIDTMKNFLSEQLTSIFRIVIVLMLLFGNLRAPIVVIVTLPLIFIGVVAGLAITGKMFDFFSLLGLLGLVGMNVKNAVVLISRIRELRDDGYEPRSAVVEAATDRLVPVVVASLTTIFGMLPLVGDSMFGSMAVTIMGGLFVATLLVLVVLPVIYTLFYRIRL